MSKDQDRELDLWKKWKGGDKKALPQLIHSMKPIVHTFANRIQAPLPRTAIEGEMTKQLIDSLHSFDPKHGVKLNTWAYNTMKNGYRWVYERQNIGRIPEARNIKVGTFQAVNQELTEKLGREPSAMELSEELMWSLSEVERMKKELRKDLIESMQVEEFSFLGESPEQKTLQYVYYELSPQERPVFEHLTGWGGKAQMNVPELARKLGKTELDIRKLQAGIVSKVRRAKGALS